MHKRTLAQVVCTTQNPSRKGVAEWFAFAKHPVGSSPGQDAGRIPAAQRRGQYHRYAGGSAAGAFVIQVRAPGTMQNILRGNPQTLVFWLTRLSKNIFLNPQIIPKRKISTLYWGIIHFVILSTAWCTRLQCRGFNEPTHNCGFCRYYAPKQTTSTAHLP